MDQELWNFFKEAYCSHLRAIRSEMEKAGGFACPQQLDDSLDCIRGVKALLKIKAMSEGATAK